MKITVTEWPDYRKIYNNYQYWIKSIPTEEDRALETWVEGTTNEFGGNDRRPCIAARGNISRPWSILYMNDSDALKLGEKLASFRPSTLPSYRKITL